MEQDNARVSNILWPVADLTAALAFYRDVVCLPVKFTDGERFAALDAGGTTLALVAGGAAVVSPATEGPHEVRTVLRDPAGQLVVVYMKR
ncbi:MAG: hypothetical protein QOE61_5358 [Micromonosporaceae bacterium]|nr:hypothetical protein [Micromonosporaceae bacterium]